MKAIYARISTANQNEERQLKEGYDFTYVDIISGAKKFKERPEAKKLLKNDKITQITVKEVSRLGRNLRDILDTLEHFTDKGIDIYIENQGLHTIVNGKKNNVAELIISILGTIAQQERELHLERVKEGVQIAKAKGKYKGRKRGSVASLESYKAKYSDIIAKAKPLKREGVSINHIAKTLEKNRGTITKLDKMGLFD